MSDTGNPPPDDPFGPPHDGPVTEPVGQAPPEPLPNITPATDLPDPTQVMPPTPTPPPPPAATPPTQQFPATPPPTVPPPVDPGGGDGTSDGDGKKKWLPIALAVAAFAVLAVIVVLLLTGGDDDESADTVAPGVTTTVPETTVPETTVPETTTSTTEATTTTSTEVTTTTTAPDPVDRRFVVWPPEGSGVSFTDPVLAARAFATEFIGFENPIVSQFNANDSQTGEVEIRSVDGGTPTIVFMSTYGTPNWYVLGAVNANIIVDSPKAGDTITSPVRLAGEAFAFEGVINVQILADGDDTPLFEDSVVGGGSELLPFDATFDWPNPGSGAGSVVFRFLGPREGEVVDATVVRVLFGP